MSKELQCPHFYRLSGVQYGCLLGRFPCNCEECDCEDNFKAGAEWQKEQMMKGAAKGTVHHFNGDKTATVHYIDPTGVPMCYFTSPEGLKAGDKVKLIIVKED